MLKNLANLSWIWLIYISQNYLINPFLFEYLVNPHFFSRCVYLWNRIKYYCPMKFADSLPILCANYTRPLCKRFSEYELLLSEATHTTRLRANELSCTRTRFPHLHLHVDRRGKATQHRGYLIALRYVQYGAINVQASQKSKVATWHCGLQDRAKPQRYFNRKFPRPHYPCLITREVGRGVPREFLCVFLPPSPAFLHAPRSGVIARMELTATRFGRGITQFSHNLTTTVQSTVLFR